MIFALSQVSTLHSPFATDVEDYAASECTALDAWLTKLEQFVEATSLDRVRGMLAEHDMTIPAASFQGGLLSTQGEARRAAWELFANRLRLCQELSIGTMVVSCDIPSIDGTTDLERVRVSLQQAAAAAEQHEVRLALEFQASSKLGSNLQTAVAFVDQTGSPGLGICLDVFHFETGSSKTEDLQLLTNDNLFVVQLCDLPLVPRELARDADRILPGDGEFDFGPLRKRLTAIKYQGVVTVELMNPQIWQVPTRQFADVGMSSLQRVLEG